MASSLVLTPPRRSLALAPIRWALELLGRALGSIPSTRPPSVQRHRGLAYLETGMAEHTLDVYRPSDSQRDASPLPAILYLHGGGFRLLSKDTHWMMADAFASRGYVVFNANYRLAPEHPYPAALEDAASALRWVRRQAASFGADPDRIVVAGESAGANLALSLALARCFDREVAPRPDSLENLPAIRACVALAGFLDVSTERPRDRESSLVRRRIGVMSRAYLGGLRDSSWKEAPFASPVALLESDLPLNEGLPPVYASVGGRDPVLADTERLERALARRGVRPRVHLAPGEGHAFQALLFRTASKASWTDLHRWLPTVLD